jgi:hypothetical protein
MRDLNFKCLAEGKGATVTASSVQGHLIILVNE